MRFLHSFRSSVAGGHLCCDRCALQATAVPALRQGVPRRAHCQPGCPHCRRGDGCSVPCAVRMGGAAGDPRRALGAVPAGARPVPHRRGALPRQAYAQAGRRSAPFAAHCSAVQRHDGMPCIYLCSSSHFNGFVSPSPRPCGAMRVRAGALQPLRCGCRARQHEGRPLKVICADPQQLQPQGGAACLVVRPHGDSPLPPSLSAGARVAVRALGGGVPAGLRGAASARGGGRARGRVPSRAGCVHGGGVRGDGGAGRGGSPHRGRPRSAPVRPRQGRSVWVSRHVLALR